MTNLDEAVEQIDNRTVYAIGCGAFGYVVYSLAKNYLRNIASIFKPEPPASGYVPGQVGHSDKPKGNWRPTGRYDEYGGEIIEFGGN